MDMTSQTIGTTTEIAVLSDRIDAASAVQFKDGFRAFAKRAEGRIVLNLTAVDFIDSSGLGAIVSAMKQLSTGQSLELAGLSPKVAKVFRLTRMDSIFTIHDTAESALANSNAA